MTKLSVNLNKVATLRNTRHGEVPDLLQAARTVLEAGAAGVTIHPRPDERHIRPTDIPGIASIVAEFEEAELNIEGNPFMNLMPILEEFRPEQCTFVPDSRDAFTSDHGWNAAALDQQISRVIARVKEDCGCRVSLFVDPDLDVVERVAEVGADRIELYTESYAHAFASGEETGPILKAFAATAEAAVRAGLEVNAGHDLNLANLGLFLQSVPNVAEVSIGHAFIADALWLGFQEAVKRYLAVISMAERGH